MSEKYLRSIEHGHRGVLHFSISQEVLDLNPLPETSSYILAFEPHSNATECLGHHMFLLDEVTPGIEGAFHKSWIKWPSDIVKSALEHFHDLGSPHSISVLLEALFHSTNIELATAFHRSEEHVILGIWVLSPFPEVASFNSLLQLLNTLLELPELPQWHLLITLVLLIPEHSDLDVKLAVLKQGLLMFLILRFVGSHVTSHFPTMHSLSHESAHPCDHWHLEGSSNLLLMFEGIVLPVFEPRPQNASELSYYISHTLVLHSF